MVVGRLDATCARAPRSPGAAGAPLGRQGSTSPPGPVLPPQPGTREAWGQPQPSDTSLGMGTGQGQARTYPHKRGSGSGLVQGTRIRHSPTMAGQGLGDGNGLRPGQDVSMQIRPGCGRAGDQLPMASLGQGPKWGPEPWVWWRGGPRGGWAGTVRAHVSAPWP